MNAVTHRRYRKEAGLAITQGWRSMAVDPKDLLDLLRSNPPATADEKDRRIAALQAELRDTQVLLRQKDRERARAVETTRHQTALDVRASMGARDNLSRDVPGADRS